MNKGNNFYEVDAIYTIDNIVYMKVGTIKSILKHFKECNLPIEKLIIAFENITESKHE